MPPNILDTESTSSTVAVREHQNVTLTCKADGYPTPKLKWKREDNQVILVDRRTKGKVFSQSIYYDVLAFARLERCMYKRNNYQSNLKSKSRNYTAWNTKISPVTENTIKITRRKKRACKHIN